MGTPWRERDKLSYGTTQSEPQKGGGGGGNGGRTIKAPVTMTTIPPISPDGCASVVSTRCWTFWKGRCFGEKKGGHVSVPCFFQTAFRLFVKLRTVSFTS